MFPAILLHPLTTFFAGSVLTLVAAGILVGCATPQNRSAEAVATYHRELKDADAVEIPAGSTVEQAAIDRFTGFLKAIGHVDSIRKETSKVYSADAYLDDTLVVHHGAAEIEKYFVKTAQTMTRCDVTIDDVSRSGKNYYVRWTMVFAAPALSKGEPVHSVGISQVRFNQQGLVTFHQDFWDSGRNFFSHLPVAGGVIGYIHKKLEE